MAKKTNSFFSLRIYMMFVGNLLLLTALCVVLCIFKDLSSFDCIACLLSVGVVLAMIDLWFVSKIGSEITRLTEYALRASSGERNLPSFSSSILALGKVSQTLGNMNARLTKISAERDREHQLAIFEEKEKLRIKKQLTTNINNELKSPVTAIQVCLETLMGHQDMPAVQQEAFLRKAYDNSMRLRRMLSDVATISRIDENSESIKIEPIDVEEIIRSVVDDFRPQAKEAKINVNVDVPHRIMIMGNSFLVMSVFHNIMDNAIVYSKATDIEIKMIADDIDSVTFQFSDNGVGVPPQHLKHLFERFYRVDKGLSRKNGGTGLGLSIVKNAVLFHGGTISAENNHYGGLRYTFSFRKM